MVFNFSSVPSSRISKRSQPKKASLKRSQSSLFEHLGQRKPIQRSRTKVEEIDEGDDVFEERLEEIGLVSSLADELSLRDVVQIVQHVHSHMFEPLPQHGGFTSVRIAEILNFRKSLPPAVTIAHIHALTRSPTATEREISELTRAGKVRRIIIPGRGTGRSSIGEAIVLSETLKRLVKDTKEIDPDLSDRFLNCIHTKPMAPSVQSGSFSESEVMCLMRAGFLTSSIQDANVLSAFGQLASTSAKSTTSIPNISRAASGSKAAAGGEDAVFDAGGRGGIRQDSKVGRPPELESHHHSIGEQELKISLPSTGPYLKLLAAARSHLISLITKSKFCEVPVYLLRERWDSGISGDDAGVKAKQYRGEFVGILPSRSRKWKQFYGLSLNWVLAECLGAGLIEIFETRSVGRAVRIP